MLAETVVAGSACVVEKRWYLRTVGGKIDNIDLSTNHIILILLARPGSRSIHVRNPLVMRISMRVNMVVMMMAPRRSCSR